jgi:hypothetical protein
MHPMFRDRPVTGAALSAASALAAVLAFTSPAAADELAVKNNSDVPVKVVVKNGAIEVGHADRIDKRSAGKVTLSPGVSLAKITPSVEATPLGVSTRCSASKSGSLYEVKCDAVASAPAASGSGSGSSTAAKRATRNLEIQNDLKDAVSVYFQHVMDGETISDKHDISAHGSATFTIPIDEHNQMSEFNIIRHLDMERVPCGVSMRYDIPTSQQKVYVTPADGSAPPPSSEKRADSKPCVLSPSSRVEKAAATPSQTPAAPGGGGTAGGTSTTKFVVENDLKDPIQISTMGGFIEEHTIGPKQSVTFDHQVPHPDGKGDTAMEVYISRSVNMRLINCGTRLGYAIPPIPEVKFYVTRVAGSEWPPKPKPGEDGGGAGGKAGPPPSPTCELTRSQNYEK